MKYFECSICGSKLYSCDLSISDEIMGALCIGIHFEHFYNIEGNRHEDIHKILSFNLKYYPSMNSHPIWEMEEKLEEEELDEKIQQRASR